MPFFWVSFVSVIAQIRLQDPDKMCLDKRLDPNGKFLPSLSLSLALQGQAYQTAGRNQGPAHHLCQFVRPSTVDPEGKKANHKTHVTRLQSKQKHKLRSKITFSANKYVIF